MLTDSGLLAGAVAGAVGSQFFVAGATPPWFVLSGGMVGSGVGWLLAKQINKGILYQMYNPRPLDDEIGESTDKK